MGTTDPRDIEFALPAVWLPKKMRYRQIGKVRWRFERKGADCWIGWYHERRPIIYDDGPVPMSVCHTGREPREERHVWVCAIPCFPLHFVYPLPLPGFETWPRKPFWRGQ